MRSSTLARKREEYGSLVEVTFARGKEGLDQQIWHQIEIDVPRTRPGVRLWMNGCTQKVCILGVHMIHGINAKIVSRKDSLCLGYQTSC